MPGDENRLYYVCLGVSMTCLSVAVAVTAVSAVAVKHVWIFGWLGCLVAFIICCCSPDSRTRADAAKLVGVGICVSFYVTKHGYFELLCNIFFCEMPLEVLVLATFIVVQCWFWWQKALSDESSKDSRSETRGVIHGSADPSDEICDDPFGDEEAMEDSSLQGRSTSHVRLPTVQESSDDQIGTYSIASLRRQLCWALAGFALLRAIDNAIAVPNGWIYPTSIFHVVLLDAVAAEIKGLQIIALAFII